MAEPRYQIGQRVGVALVRHSREFDYTAVITSLPPVRSPYYTGTSETGEEILFSESEIVTTLPAGEDLDSLDAWLNGR